MLPIAGFTTAGRSPHNMCTAPCQGPFLTHLSLFSVGYSTCHWCHVMEEESFKNEEIGEIMNKNFVCIKVDREERPDVDKVYMTFVQVRKHGQGLDLLSQVEVHGHVPQLRRTSMWGGLNGAMHDYKGGEKCVSVLK